MTLVTIPLGKLSCEYCKLLVNGKCQLTGGLRENPIPCKDYCLHIFSQYKGGENDIEMSSITEIVNQNEKEI